MLDRTFDIPVLIEINPGRLGLPDSEESLMRATADINTWIRQGLVATIKSQNFLLGSRLVDLQYEEGASQDELAYFKDLVVIPAGVDSLEKFTDSIEALIAKINHLPIESVVRKLQLQSIDYSYYLKNVDWVERTDYRLRLRIDSLQATDKGEVVAAGRYQLISEHGSKPHVLADFNFHRDLGQDGYEHVVEQIQALLTQIAEAIVNSLEGLGERGSTQ